MDSPLDPPLRVQFQVDNVHVGLSEAHLVIQRFVDESKASGSGSHDDATEFPTSARGMSPIVVGQLQRLSDSLAKQS